MIKSPRENQFRNLAPFAHGQSDFKDDFKHLPNDPSKPYKGETQGNPSCVQTRNWPRGTQGEDSKPSVVSTKPPLHPSSHRASYWPEGPLKCVSSNCSSSLGAWTANELISLAFKSALLYGFTSLPSMSSIFRHRWVFEAMTSSTPGDLVLSCTRAVTGQRLASVKRPIQKSGSSG